jgi:hypothetical protein
MPTKKTETFVCADTGIELKIRHIPFTVTDKFFPEYDKQFPPPKPPMHKVDYGEGEQVDEPNLSDTTYARLLVEHEQKKAIWCDDKAKHLYATLAVECPVDEEAVKQLRDTMKGLGVELDPDDKFVYVWYIAVGTTQGHNELMQAIMRRIQPTGEAVAQAQTTFRSQV